MRTVLPAFADGVQIHRLSASGPLVVFDETGYGGDAGSGRRIWLADMEHETLRVLATGADGDGAWTPQISRQQVVWIEVRYLGDNVWLTGECRWRIVALDLGTGAVHQVAAGVNHRIAGQNAPPPRLALSDGRIAYTVEQASGTGDDIVIRSFDTNAVLENLPAEGTVHSLALSGSTVVWSEGTLDAGGGFVYDTRLHVARSSSPSVVIAKDAFQVGIAGDLLAWVSDPARGQSSFVHNAHIWVASTGDLRPAQLPGPRDPGLERAARWPAVGDGMVTWAEDLSGSGNPDPTGPHLVIWSRRTGTTAQLEPTGGMILSSVGGGWVCWNHPLEPVALHAARLADLDLP